MRPIFPRNQRLTGARWGVYIRELGPMIDSRSLRRWLLIAGTLAAGCNSSSPLVWSAADDLDNDDDGDERVTEEPDRPPPPPPPKDAGMVEEDPMDSGVIVAEPPARRPPCGTGPGCDPTDLGGETCESLGAGSGRLLCDSVTCLFELAACDGLPQDASVGRPCGTGPGCITDDLGGETCVSLGMQAGTLRCDEETCMYDTSLCGPGGGIGGAGSTFGGGTGAGNNGEGGSASGGFFGGGNDDGGTSFFGGDFFGGGNDGGTSTFGGNFFGGE